MGESIETWQCEGCDFFPKCRDIQDMRERHGTPHQFASEVNNAADNLMVTTAEALAAIVRYNRCWAKAPDKFCKPQLPEKVK